MNTNEIESVVAEYIRGITQSNTDSLIPLFTHDAVVMAPDAPTVQGTEQLRAFFAQNFGAVKLDAKIHFDDVVIDGDLAYVRTHSDVKVTVLAANVTQPEQNRELFVFRKVNSAWKIARYMFNKLPAAK